MAAPTTSRDLLEVIRRSGLIDPAKLREWIAFESSSSPDELVRQLVAAGLLTPFQAGQIRLGRWKGFLLAGYKLLDKLGKGGMGQVFLAEHQLLKKKVALKVLAPDLASDKQILARFAREARAAAAVSHRNIVHMIDIDIDHQPPFLVMEYINGLTLQASVAIGGTYSAGLAAWCGVQAATALQAAHAAGLVHRDIKPANLVIDTTGTVKLLDLGIVRMDMEDEGLTAGGGQPIILGTADYVAPEQALDSHQVDIRADIYGLGGSLYFLLAGHSPYPEGSTNAKLTRKQLQDPTPIQKLRPDLPAPFAAAIHLMMHRKREGRPATPREVVELLQPWATNDEAYLRKLFKNTGVSANTPHPLPSLPPQNREPTRTTPTLISGESTTRAGIAIAEPPQVEQPTIRVVIPAELEQTSYDPNWVMSDSFAYDSTSSNTDLNELFNAIETETNATPTRSAPQPGPRSWKRYALIAGGSCVLMLVLSGIVFAVVLSSRSREVVASATTPTSSRPAPTRPTATLTPPATAVVSRGRLTFPISKTQPASFRTITEALKLAKDNSRIEIRDPIWEENVLLPNDVLLARNLEIVGFDAASPTVWRSKSARPEDLTLKLYLSRGAKIANIHFDGSNRQKIGVEISGSGVEAENCTFSGFTHAALILHSLHTDTGPNLVSGCRFLKKEGLEGLTCHAMLLHGDPRAITGDVISVTDNRYEGPFATAIQVLSPIRSGLFGRNRILNAKIGIDISPTGAGSVLRVERNTFAQVGSAFNIYAGNGIPGSNLRASGNIFARVGTVANLLNVPTKLPTPLPFLWDQPYAVAEGRPHETRYFRHKFFLPTVFAPETTYTLDLGVSSHYRLWVNGNLVSEHADLRTDMAAINITPQLKTGENVLALEVSNRKLEGNTLAGFCAQLTRNQEHAPLWVAGHRWKAATTVSPDWHLPTYADDQWAPATVLRMPTGSLVSRDLDSVGEAQRYWPPAANLFQGSQENLITVMTTRTGAVALPQTFFPLGMSIRQSDDSLFLRTVDAELPVNLQNKFGVPLATK